MARGKDRFIPSSPVDGSSVGASKRMSNAMAAQPTGAVTVTPILPTIPQAPPVRSPAARAIDRIRAEILSLALRAPQGEEVYLDVLGVRYDFEVVRVREASDVEVAFDGLDARGQPAKVLQHHSQISYHLRIEPPAAPHQPIGFHFHGDPDTVV